MRECCYQLWSICPERGTGSWEWAPTLRRQAGEGGKPCPSHHFIPAYGSHSVNNGVKKWVEFEGAADIWVNFVPKLVPWLITVRASHSRHMVFKCFPVPWAAAIIIWWHDVYDLPSFPGSGPMSSDRPEQGREGVSSHYSELLRAGNVWQGQPEAGPGQGCSSGHKPKGQHQWSEYDSTYPGSPHHTAGAPLESSFLQLFGESHSLNGVSSHVFVESFPTAESNSGSAVHILRRHKGNL